MIFVASTINYDFDVESYVLDGKECDYYVQMTIGSYLGVVNKKTSENWNRSNVIKNIFLYLVGYVN